MLEDRIEQDIKSALLGGDKRRVSVLRGLKATLLNIKVATGKRDTGLSDDEVIAALAKEAKKRTESADLYLQGGDQNRQEAELAEKAIIDEYLPDRLSDQEVTDIIDQVISDTGASSPQVMGQVIGRVKAEVGPLADGSTIAKLVKDRLT
jgi:uncharacterized protein YqeY